MGENILEGFVEFLPGYKEPEENIQNNSEIITLNDDQNAALLLAKVWWLSGEKRPFILEGCAGSGKTTIIKFLVEEIGITKYNVVFCTFTGKAASQLQRKGNNATTIHKLIYNPFEDPKTHEIRFTLKPEIEGDIKLIVVDEYGMVDDKMMNDLESFGIPIILVGDPYQLPPIGKPNKYLVLPETEKDIILTQPMRQSLDSPIVYLADLARKGERIKYGNYGNCKVIRKSSIDIDEFLAADQIIAGKNITVKKLNQFYRHNKGIRGVLPKKGERLMCLKNDWRTLCTEGNISTSLINGLPVILETDFVDTMEKLKIARASVRPEFFTESKFSNIQIDLMFFEKDWNNFQEYQNIKDNESFKDIIERRRNFEFGTGTRINPFTFGYVCTCYKFQGSEAPNVFFIQEYMGKNIYKQHLYTGITRASEKLTLVL